MTTFRLDRIPDPEANPPRADLLLAQQRLPPNHHLVPAASGATVAPVAPRFRTWHHWRD